MINYFIGGTLIQIVEMVRTSFGGWVKLSNGNVWIVNQGKATRTPYKDIPVFTIETVAC